MKLIGHKQIYELHNIYSGRRCFVMGSGPSLNQTPIDRLKGELVIGCNTLYKLHFPFTFFGVSDIHVWKNHCYGILAQPTNLVLTDGARAHFFSHQLKYELQANPTMTIFHVPTIKDMKYIQSAEFDLSVGVYHGGTVIVDICLQLAFYLGCNPIYLVGVDFNYSGAHHWDGTQADIIDGCAKGIYHEVEHAFHVCDTVFTAAGRDIIDCTPGGKLPMFRKMKVEEVVDG